MSSIWIVTEGDYSDNHIVGVFSTKEKAYEYYYSHVEESAEHRYTSYYEPEEYSLDKVSTITRCIVSAVKEKGIWCFYISGTFDDNDRECGYVYEKSKRKEYWITVSYNPNREVMKKAAQDYLFKYLARQEGI